MTSIVFRAVVMAAFLVSCVGDAPDDPAVGADDGSPSAGTRSLPVGFEARVVGTDGIGLRLRAGAGTNFSVLALMPEGAIVRVIAGPQGPWYRVTYLDQTGWAHGDYLQTTAAAGANNLLPWTPNTSYVVTQGHNGGSHTGLGAWAWDFGMDVGTPILAAHFGVARLVKGDSTVGGCDSRYGNDANFVIIDQGNGYESLYLHLSAVNVTQGETVSRGDLIGWSGQTGWACGAHLHFQIQLDPQNGGGNGFYNPSIHDYFYDTGAATDPPVGTVVTSQNGVVDVP